MIIGVGGVVDVGVVGGIVVGGGGVVVDAVVGVDVAVRNSLSGGKYEGNSGDNSSNIQHS